MADTGNLSTAAAARRTATQIDPDLRGLLDHIAVELAEEYVRLMEAAAAEAETPQRHMHERPEETHQR